MRVHYMKNWYSSHCDFAIKKAIPTHLFIKVTDKTNQKIISIVVMSFANDIA